MPEHETAYQPSISVVEQNRIPDVMQNRAYGGMPIQIGMCWGYNTKLNCLEHHWGSEVNISEQDVVLPLAMENVPVAQAHGKGRFEWGAVKNICSVLPPLFCVHIQTHF